jgi:chorismate mutase/prephenate dehydratase
VLVRNIEDEPGNTTRFLVIGRQRVPPSGDDKTSLLLSTRNEAGGLHRLLSPLAAHGISMTRIESRPSRRGMWDYVFFLDLEGHAEDAKLASALADLKALAGMYKQLGSYPRAVI